jgi:hypothetical protein
MPPSSQARTAEEGKYINVFLSTLPLTINVDFYWVFISESYD